MWRLLLASFFVFPGCDFQRSLLVAPGPITLEEGASAKFVLDPSQSSDILKSGELVMTVDSITDTETTISSKGKMQTSIGDQKVDMSKPIENEILNFEFMEKLRSEKTYQAKKMFIEHVGLTAVGCDKLRLSNIEGQQGVTIEPVLCLAAQTIPTMDVKLDFFGQNIKAAFRQTQ